MGLCIGVLEDDLREAVNDIDKDKFVYKFLSDTDKYDMYLEELGVKTITDCVIFSGVMNDVRQLRYKKPGREATEGWRQVVNKIFDEERHLAIVNDYWDYPNMVLVFPKVFQDYSAVRKEIDITFPREIYETIMDLVLTKLSRDEGINTVTYESYKTGVYTDDDPEDKYFKMVQDKIKKENKSKYKEQLMTNFTEAFKFRLISYYTKLREYGLEDIMRKLDELGYLDERFNNEIYIYEEEARRLLARRLCAISYKNDIELLIEQGIIDKDKITYDLN